MDARALTQIGPYQVRRFIAEGGMAWVFEVTDPRFEGRDVVRALKMLKPTAAVGEEFQRFRSEAGLLAGIDHPNLITIFDFGKDEATDCFYYTMTFVDGPTMSDYLAEHGPFSVKEGVRIFADLLGALAELHDRGIVHRDIKPANVLIGSDGRARLADLGIARAEQDHGLTKTGMAVGTVLYMSPEQARGREVRATSDVFSVGLTLYEALTGRVVYDHVEDIDSTSQHDVLGYLVSLSRTGEELEIVYPAETAIPEPVRAVIAKACRFFPEERYTDARAMRTALEESVAPALPTASASRWPWVASVGIAVVALGATAAYFVKSNIDRHNLENRVEQELADGTRLDDSLKALVERTKDLDPPPPREFLVALEKTLERADVNLVEAQEDFEAGSVRAAGAGVARSIRGFEGACSQLTSGQLAARADARVKAANERVAALREEGAPKHLPEDWAGLESQVAALAPPSAALGPCGIAASHLDRIDGAAQTLVAAAALERGLEVLWPRLAAGALAEAEKAQKLAESESVDAVPYVEARDAGRDALAEGRRLEKADDFLGARGRYREAAKHFQTAAAIVPAAKARDEVRRMEEEAAAKGTPVRGKAGLMTSRAGQLYADGQWKESAQIYEQAAIEMRRAMEIGELEEVARRARTEARTAREIAVKERAEGAAPRPLAQGDEARDAGETALTEQRYEEAAEAFGTAQGHYAEAKKIAIEALGAADHGRRQWLDAQQQLLGSEGCDRLESATARDECNAAAGDASRAEAALAGGDAATAVRSYQTAMAALERAGIAEDEFQGSKPRPPEIVARTPKRDRVQVFRNRSVKLAVEARDPNPGDRLRYAWKVDGTRLEQEGPEIEYRPQASGQVAVVVDDGRGGSATATWDVVVENRRPTLSVSPTSQRVALTLGQTQEFQATVRDPDGDPVVTEFLLDGRSVGTGTAYTFSPTAPGDHTLQVIATDEAGARTKLTRTIAVATQVARRAPERIPEPPAPRPAPPVRKEPPPSPKPVVTGWEAGVHAALEEYEAALEQKDMDRLARVWVFKPGSMYKRRWESKFRKPDPLEVQVDIRKVDREGDHKATVLFEQTESSAGRTRTYAYRAVLIERTSTGEWQIIDNHIERN
jgi:serine/threonine protein kinase